MPKIIDTKADYTSAKNGLLLSPELKKVLDQTSKKEGLLNTLKLSRKLDDSSFTKNWLLKSVKL
jgi:hypothetical protein